MVDVADILQNLESVLDANIYEGFKPAEEGVERYGYYYEYSSVDTHYADGEPHCVKENIQVHFFTKDMQDLKEVKNLIRTYLRAEDFCVEAQKTLHEDDTGYWHSITECTYYNF